MMSRTSVFAGCVVLLRTLFTPAACAAQGTAPSIAEIERRISEGDRAGARVVAESLLTAIPASRPEYPDILYWRAFTAANAAEAERDYLRVTVEFPLSSHAADALLNLALLEYARGDREGALRHFNRLLTEHPQGPLTAKASYWSGRLSLEGGDARQGCAALATARRQVQNGDVELANQIEYYSARCAAFADSVARGSADSAARAAKITADSLQAARRTGPEFSIQVGAYTERREATSAAARLKSRGFEARVAGTRAPYRVRIGRYASRQAALAELARVRRSNPSAIVVEAEPR